MANQLALPARYSLPCHTGRGCDPPSQSVTVEIRWTVDSSWFSLLTHALTLVFQRPPLCSPLFDPLIYALFALIIRSGGHLRSL